jgi:D-isomer specific 2-hydroxyacid dehydrogenase, catalytic domain
LIFVPINWLIVLGREEVLRVQARTILMLKCCTQPSLTVTTAPLAKDHDAVSLFVNDECNEEVSVSIPVLACSRFHGINRLLLISWNRRVLSIARQLRKIFQTVPLFFAAVLAHLASRVPRRMATLVPWQVVKQLADCGVRFIAMRCAGYDRVDVESVYRHGLKIARVPAYSPDRWPRCESFLNVNLFLPVGTV